MKLQSPVEEAKYSRLAVSFNIATVHAAGRRESRFPRIKEKVKLSRTTIEVSHTKVSTKRLW
ncbi:hypothetical protein ACTJIJ_15020 [Niabella sp. 22666]|uniref:hypothetical protein n=1 Tax=Niabella sp. 22666 TaxID=3453954 RepID=UPI003F83453A